MKKGMESVVFVIISCAMILISAPFVFGQSSMSSFQIVNLDTTDPLGATCSVSYYDQNGVKQTYEPTYNIPPGGSKTITIAMESLLDAGRYSAVLSSDKPVASIVNQQQGLSGSTSSYPVFSSYSGIGSTEAASTVTLPSIMYNWYGYYTEVYIQNTTETPATNIVMTYNPTSIGSCATGATGQSDLVATVGTPLAANTASLVSQSAKSNLGAPSVPACASYNGRFLGSATITADQPIAVVVNQKVPNKLFTYNGFTLNGAKLLVPAYLRNYYGYYASLTISNPNASDVTVNLTYRSDPIFSNPVNTTVNASHLIPAGKSITLYDGASATSVNSDLTTLFPSPSGKFFGTVVIESTDPLLPVVALVNQESTLAAGNQAGSYNAFVSSEGGTRLNAPLIQSNFYGFYTSLTIMTVDGGEANVRITYTSDDTYSSNKNVTKSYDLTTTGGFLNRYEGPTASAAQSDVLDDAFWTGGGTHRFIGSATIEVLSGSSVVAYVNSESSSVQNASTMDTLYSYNAIKIQ